jgi:hypothetical protein
MARTVGKRGDRKRFFPPLLALDIILRFCLKLAPILAQF